MVLTLVLVGIAGALGRWQYDAWQAHREAEARDLSGVTPVPLGDVMGADDPFPAPDLGRPVEVRGGWLEGGFWVADRELDGRDGYWAVDPLQVGDAAVLGMSPALIRDYARVVPRRSLEDLTELRVLGVSPQYIASVQRPGQPALSNDELIEMRLGVRQLKRMRRVEARD